MKTPTLRPITRMFPIGTAAYNSRLLATLFAGTSLLGATAQATVWDGSTSADWNDLTNWVGDNGTGGSNAEININAPAAVISANIVATPVDILVGNGAGTTGRLDHTAGTAATGGGNWMLVGRQDGGNGIYNLANTAGSGGTLTTYGLGSGTMNVAGRLYVGGANYVGSIGNGTVNVNTSGTLAIGNDLAVGSAGGTGLMNVDAGTITTGGWNFIGKNEAAAGAVGTLNMSGGLLTNTGRTYVGQAGSTGNLNLSGGTYRNVNNEQFIFGEGAGGVGNLSITNASSVLQSGGELWFGQASGAGNMTMTAGAVTVNNWVAIGRDGGTGICNMSGGSFTKTGGGNFIVGASGPGTWTQTGGLVDIQGGITWMGENSTATVDISGTAEYRTTNFTVAANGASTATVGLDGGTLRVGQILGGGGTAQVDFNGTQIIATATQANFISNLDIAALEAGGLKLDTNTFNVATSQAFSGTGGVTKSGAGTLTLSGTSDYTGLEASNGGTLMVTPDALNTTNNVTVANGAGYGVSQSIADTVLNRNNVTFGTTGPSRLEINLGNLPGNPTVAPLKVNGTLTLNGTVSVNLADQLPEVGSIPLLSYTGPKAGAGTFVLGTLPNGVVATLSDAGGLVSLNITSVALPYWDATADNVWNTTTTNWINLVGGAPVTYKNGNPVLFDDLANGPGGGADVALNTTVTPASVTFNNSLLNYSLSGTGKISGTTGLVKQGTATLTLGTLNDYTGVTSLDGGTTLVATLANGSAASSLGAASAAPANLLFNGGSLDYTGATTATDRGLTVAGNNSTFTLQNDVTLSGPIVTTGGNLTKAGPGNLTLTNAAYNIGLTNPGVRVASGTLTLDGAGSQTVTVGNDLWIGNVPDVPAALVLKNTTLNVGGFIALGRGNGNTGTLSTISATNSTITTANFSTGFDGDLGSNDSDQTITLNNSTWTTNGRSLLGESANSTTTLTVSGTSVYQANDQLLMGMGTGSVVNLIIENSGRVTKTGGWLAIGNSNNGQAIVTVKDSGTLTADGDFNIGDVGTSQGTLNISGSASVSATGTVFVGKNDGTSGTLNLTGGTFNSVNYITIGRRTGAIGVVNLTGGTINQTDAGAGIIVGENGTGTLNVNSGSINIGGGGLYLTAETVGTGNGTVNLNGGTVTAKRVVERDDAAGNVSTLNFNGGLLVAGAGANPVFMNNLDSAFVQSGGAFINSNGNNIAIDQPLLAGLNVGGLTKSGLGALQLNGASTYTGLTSVTAGTLGGTGSVAGPLTTAAGTTLAPGAGAPGTFSVGGATTLSGTYAVEIDGGSNDTLAVTNTLNVSAATLAITTLTGGATQSAYVIATYTGATPAPFASVTGLPPGYAVNYAYNDGVSSTNIAIVSSVAPPAYTLWISGFYPGETDPAIIGTSADPDKDGQANALEFALGGAPNSGSNNAKIYTLAADSDGDGDTTAELLMTIAVRTGTPAFTGSPAPSATFDGITVSAEGGSLLTTFPTVVTPVGVVATGLPAAPSGYQYRTFSLSGSNGLTGKGFIRARVAF